MKPIWLAVALCTFASSILAEDITIDGVTYENFHWGRATPTDAEIIHRSGIATIPLESLPSELQKKFNYDPKESAEYRLAQARAVEQARQARQANDTKLGVEWDSAEGDNIKVSAWRGPWVRRGKSNVFDCRQPRGGTGHFVVTVTMNGDQVTAYREDINDKGETVPYTYRGRVMRDGTIVGSISRTGWQGQWEAKIKQTLSTAPEVSQQPQQQTAQIPSPSKAIIQSPSDDSEARAQEARKKSDDQKNASERKRANEEQKRILRIEISSLHAEIDTLKQEQSALVRWMNSLNNWSEQAERKYLAFNRAISEKENLLRAKEAQLWRLPSS